jgi:hypothetical protein
VVHNIVCYIGKVTMGGLKLLIFLPTNEGKQICGLFKEVVGDGL